MSWDPFHLLLALQAVICKESAAAKLLLWHVSGEQSGAGIYLQICESEHAVKTGIHSRPYCNTGNSSGYVHSLLGERSLRVESRLRKPHISSTEKDVLHTSKNSGLPENKKKK